MENKSITIGEHFKPEERERVSKAVDDIIPDKNVTEEEFQNFMHRVTEVEKIVKKLASSDVKEQEYGKFLADEILERNVKSEIIDGEEVKVKSSRTIINKFVDRDPSEQSQEAFKRTVEKDAKKRAEDRKIRNARAEIMKRIGNAAFKERNFEKAVTYFTKAVEQRKDSTVLWNNRALAYMQLGLYEKALLDCEWALKVNNSNIKALLNSAKCHSRLNDDRKAKEFIERAKETNPHFENYIKEFEADLAGEEEDLAEETLHQKFTDTLID